MFFEDGRDLTVAAVTLLQSQKEDMGCPSLKIWSPPEFRTYAETQKLTLPQKQTIVDQAILLIDQFYAHLPFKRARYAIDPVQSLRLIRAQLEDLSDPAFHEHMIESLISLRDAHTFYALPKPYKGAMVFLPFRLKYFHDRTGKRRFIVTDILDAFDHPRFNIESEVISWNGAPIEQAIEREGQKDPGGNPSSRFARGVNRMCSRSLSASLPPREEYVVIEYLSSGSAEKERDRHAIILPWHIATDCIINKQRYGDNSSVNESMADMAQARKMLFHRTAVIREKKRRDRAAQPVQPAAAPDTPADFSQVSHYPNVFAFQYSGGVTQPDGVDPAALHDHNHSERKFGYLRIRTFDLDPSDKKASDKFVGEFQRIATLMQEVAPDGLIIDVRSNPGGSIDAAERILQNLTPQPIRPADFHFISTRTTQQVATALARTKMKGVSTAGQLEWTPWVMDLLSSVANGRVITPGRPLTQPEQANDTGQIYQGPVALLVDALAYSATDIFAAGFQDHKIGKVIGVDANTGGGGANRWLHEELMQNLALPGLHMLPLEKLPCEAQLGLAIRRSTRVAHNAGNVLEDVGVEADLRHHVTKRDLLHNDRDLLAFACTHLGMAEAYQLKIDNLVLTGDFVQVSIQTRNLFRIECLINGLTQCSFPADGADVVLHDFLVPVAGLIDTPETLTLNGFARTMDSVRGAELNLVVQATRVFEAATGASS